MIVRFQGDADRIQQVVKHFSLRVEQQHSPSKVDVEISEDEDEDESDEDDVYSFAESLGLRVTEIG